MCGRKLTLDIVKENRIIPVFCSLSCSTAFPDNGTAKYNKLMEEWRNEDG